MKILSLFIAVIFTFSLSGQITERNFDISLGTQNAYMMDHIDAEKKMVEKALDETFKQFGKVKRNRKAKEWACVDCQISAISTSPVNVYYRVEEGKGQVTSYTFFDDGTKFISSENDPDANTSIEKLNMEVFHHVRRAVISKELEDAEDDLKDFQKDLSKLEKKNKGLHEDIDDYKEKIVKAEKEIEENLQGQEDKNIEIAKQKKAVEAITDKLNNVGRG